MDNKTLTGGITNDSGLEYTWVTEPGACEKCKALDGTTYKTADDVPDKPHPNCKCHVRVRKTRITATDPLERLREERKQQQNAQIEQERQEGQVKILKDECLVQLEAIRFRIGEDIYKELLEYISQADNKNVLVIILHKLFTLWQLKSNEKLRDDYLVENANVLNANLYGKYHKFRHNMPEAYEFFMIGIKDKLNLYDYINTLKYIKKNGHMYNNLVELNNPQEAKRILDRIHEEDEEKDRTDTRLLILNENSSVSQKIRRSIAIINFILNNTTRLVNNETITNQKIEFTNIDEDLFSTFHGAMIRKAYIDYNGDLIITLEDYYNFNPDRTSVKGRVGYKLQKQGDLIPYYVIVNITIPRKMYEAIW